MLEPMLQRRTFVVVGEVKSSISPLAILPDYEGGTDHVGGALLAFWGRVFLSKVSLIS
jgi:hypothetical protein